MPTDSLCTYPQCPPQALPHPASVMVVPIRLNVSKVTTVLCYINWGGSSGCRHSHCPPASLIFAACPPHLSHPLLLSKKYSLTTPSKLTSVGKGRCPAMMFSRKLSAS